MHFLVHTRLGIAPSVGFQVVKGFFPSSSSPGENTRFEETNRTFLRNLADARCGMLRGCAAFHALRFLQMIPQLCLMVLLLILSVLILFAPMEYAKLEQIEFCTTIHTSFNQLQPIHISF